MSAETSQINWSECPIGQRCESSTLKLEAAYDTHVKKLDKLSDSIDNLSKETSKIGGKLTLVITLVVAITLAGYSFIFDVLKELVAQTHLKG